MVTNSTSTIYPAGLTITASSPGPQRLTTCFHQSTSPIYVRGAEPTLLAGSVGGGSDVVIASFSLSGTLLFLLIFRCLNSLLCVVLPGVTNWAVRMGGSNTDTCLSISQDSSTGRIAVIVYTVGGFTVGGTSFYGANSPANSPMGVVVLDNSGLFICLSSFLCSSFSSFTPFFFFV
jgi:hypothetical protein